MLKCDLPSVLTNDPITISSNVEYDRAAKVMDTLTYTSTIDCVTYVYPLV